MSILERVAAVVKRVFPKRFLDNIERRLRTTYIPLTAEEYVGLTLLLTIGACIIIGAIGLLVQLPIPVPLLMIIIILVVFPSATLGIPYYLAQRRAAELERVLPDALRQMASTLRAGISIEATMDDIVKSKYGPLSLEFDRAIMEIRRGRPLGSALLAIARRSNSLLYERAFHLIVEGIERGAALASVLDSVSSDIREVHAIQRERITATTQQVLFLLAVAIVAAPLIMGLTVGVSEGLTAATAAMPTGGMTALPAGTNTIVMFYILIQAVICSLAFGVIRYGKIVKGLGFSVPFMAIAAIFFYIAQTMV